MSGLFASGIIVYLVIGVLVVEAVVLIARRHDALNVIVAALPGICLLMALHAALTGAGWIVIAVWLALSLPAHLADLWRRPP